MLSVTARLARRARCFCLLAAILSGAAHAYDASSGAADAGDSSRQFTFAWPYLPGERMAPRGGTTTGEDVALATGPGAAWLELRKPGLSGRERDRLAILAMAGPYRATFDFIETVGFTEGYEPDPPYQSWGTEYVYVLADEPDFISLQHIMVIRVAAGEGRPAETLVVKHWRQDWRYQAREMHVFDGHRQWRRRTLTEDEARGGWVQSVYEVDDSPRYAAAGRWEHTANFSSWTSEETWRPLPRREFSVRDDYDVLIGTNRHTITPTGWVQEEHNLKTLLDERGGIVRMLARENGLARYERIEGFDWSPGDDYWRRTGPFWEVVRSVWRDYFSASERLEVKKSANDEALFVVMFELAEMLTADGFDPDLARAEVERVLAPYISR